MSKAAPYPSKTINTPSRDDNKDASLDRCVNVLEAAQRLGLHPRTLDNWRSQQRGPRYIRLGRRIVYRLSDLQSYMDKRVVEGDE